MNEEADMVIIYDGDCPFCRRYVQLMTLRKHVGKVDLIDARSGDRRVIAAQAEGYDLEKGMLARFGNRAYHGADAVALLADLSNNRTFVQRFLSRILVSPKRAAILYPIMRFGRRLTLLLLGRSRIKSLSA